MADNDKIPPTQSTSLMPLPHKHTPCPTKPGRLGRYCHQLKSPQHALPPPPPHTQSKQFSVQLVCLIVY